MFVCAGIASHAESNPLTRRINFQNRYANDISGLHDIMRIFDEFVCKLADVHQAVLMHSDIDKGPKCSNIRHGSFQLHSWLEIRDLGDTFHEGSRFEAGARIAPRLRVASRGSWVWNSRACDSSASDSGARRRLSAMSSDLDIGRRRVTG